MFTIAREDAQARIGYLGFAGYQLFGSSAIVQACRAFRQPADYKSAIRQTTMNSSRPERMSSPWLMLVVHSGSGRTFEAAVNR